VFGACAEIDVIVKIAREGQGKKITLKRVVISRGPAK
jgi:hypothetical protein